MANQAPKKAAPEEIRPHREWLYGAIGALTGSLIGASASVLIAYIGINHQEDDRLYNAKRDSYTRYLATVQDGNTQITGLYQGIMRAKDMDPKRDSSEALQDAYAADREKLVLAVGEIFKEGAAVNVYANEDVLTNSAYLSESMNTAAAAVPKQVFSSNGEIAAFEEAVAEVNATIGEYLRAVRKDLDIPVAAFDEGILPTPVPPE